MFLKQEAEHQGEHASGGYDRFVIAEPIAIFSRALILLQLALWRHGLRTLPFVDDIILVDMPPPASPEPESRFASLQERGRVPSPRLVPIDTELPLGVDEHGSPPRSSMA